jgi:hypothetical protein
MRDEDLWLVVKICAAILAGVFLILILGVL